MPLYPTHTGPLNRASLALKRLAWSIAVAVVSFGKSLGRTRHLFGPNFNASSTIRGALKPAELTTAGSLGRRRRLPMILTFGEARTLLTDGGAFYRQPSARPDGVTDCERSGRRAPLTSSISLWLMERSCDTILPPSPSLPASSYFLTDVSPPAATAAAAFSRRLT